MDRTENMVRALRDAQAHLEEEAGAQEAQAQALVDVLCSVLHPEHVWREELNGRWVVFVRHEEQTYCLLPLEYETVGGPRGR